MTRIAQEVAGGIQSVPLGRKSECAGHWGPFSSALRCRLESTGPILKRLYSSVPAGWPPRRASQHLIGSEKAEICLFKI